MNKSDKWIEEYLIPKLISDGKILSTGVDNFTTNNTLHVVSSSKANHRTNNHHDNNNGSNVGIVSGRWDGGDNKNENNVEIKSLNIKTLSVDGFMLSAPCKVVEIECIDKRKPNCVNKLFLVVKSTPKIPKDDYDLCLFDSLFRNEVIAYTEIIPLLSHAKKYPRFYYAECNYDLENCNFGAFCVLDDFSQFGWKTSKYVYDLPLDYVLLAVEELGHFHGEMYAMKHTENIHFKDILNKLKEPRWSIDHISEGYNAQLEMGPIRAVKVFKESDLGKKVDNKLLEKLLEYVKVPLTFLQKILKPREPLATLCHGDYLRNNIAFKLDATEKPLDVMMYDFQTLRYSSPMVDFALLLLVSVTHDVRAKNFDQIFNTYFSTLVKSYCVRANVSQADLPAFMSSREFLKEYLLLFPYAFVIASSFLPLLYEPMFTEGNWFDLPQPTPDEFREDWKTRGGEPLNFELRHMLLEFFELLSQFKNFDFVIA